MIWIFFHEFNFFYASAENNQNWNFIYFKFSGNIKESYLVNPSPPSTLQKAKRRKWFREKYSSKNNKNYKNQDVGIPYPFRKPKKHTQTGTGTKPETEAKIKSSFGSQKITHSELKFRKMSIFVEQKRIFFYISKCTHFLPFQKWGKSIFTHTKKVWNYEKCNFLDWKKGRSNFTWK